MPTRCVTREWLVTNGLGGYASGTVAGVMTRRYHGLLIAALPAPLGRTVMLSHVAEQLRCADGRRFEIGGASAPATDPDAHGHRLPHRVPPRGGPAGLALRRRRASSIEKRVFMPHMQNTVYLMYELLAGADRVELALRPSVNFRAQEAPVSDPLACAVRVPLGRRRTTRSRGRAVRLPPLRLKLTARGRRSR